MNDDRNYLRYDPDDNALAVIHPSSGSDEQIVGLLRDESHSGWAAIFQEKTFDLNPGDHVTAKAGPHTPTRVEVKWTKPVDEKFIKAGFARLDEA